MKRIIWVIIDIWFILCIVLLAIVIMWAEPRELKEAEVVSVHTEAEQQEEMVDDEPETHAARYSGAYFKQMGEIHENGWRYTWYSSNVARHYRTSEWVVDFNGIYRDVEGYVVVACDSIPQGGCVQTPFGVGKVYDCGCGYGTIDIYVNF